MDKVLLNLDTLVVRPKISIDGQHHEILSPDELSVVTSHLLSVKGKRLDALMGLTELDDDERGELQDLVREISDIVMEPVPASIRRKLTESQLMSVTEAFMTLLLAKRSGTVAALMRSLVPDTAKPPKQKGQSTGEKRSPGSSGSSEGRQAGGCTKRRSHS